MRPQNHHPIDVHVGGRVRLRRMVVGMSQEKLGEHLGITFQQIQKYEKGTNRISASMLSGIARVLGVSEAFFFEGQPGEPTAGNAADPLAGLDGPGVRIAIEAGRLTPHQRQAVLSVIRAIAGEAPHQMAEAA